MIAVNYSRAKGCRGSCFRGLLHQLPRCLASVCLVPRGARDRFPETVDLLRPRVEGAGGMPPSEKPPSEKPQISVDVRVLALEDGSEFELHRFQTKIAQDADAETIAQEVQKLLRLTDGFTPELHVDPEDGSVFFDAWTTRPATVQFFYLGAEEGTIIGENVGAEEGTSEAVRGPPDADRGPVKVTVRAERQRLPKDATVQMPYRGTAIWRSQQDKTEKTVKQRHWKDRAVDNIQRVTSVESNPEPDPLPTCVPILQTPESEHVEVVDVGRL